jgi:hypothetical protein
VESAGARGTTGADEASPAPVRLFTLADARHFTGLVGLVNSVRLLGHREPITVLDIGLEPWQREAVAAECDVVDAPEHSPRHPWLLEPHACRTRDAEVVVYIDADVVLTSRLDDVVAVARAGKVLLYGDAMTDRRFESWHEIFGLRAPLRAQPYANAGFLAFSTRHFPDLLARWAECCEQLVGHATYLDTFSFASPTALSSQDALNAILMSEIDPERLDLRSTDLVAQGPHELTDARVADVHSLLCRRNGRVVVLLHAWGRPKPWEPSAGRTLRRSAYVTCLRRLLTGRDVAVRVPDETVAPWLRSGVRGRSSLWLVTQAQRPWRGARERAKGLVALLATRMLR